jgi:YidC/Oxa1 family membrane protein insertase
MEQQPKLFDSRTMLAIVVIGVFYIGWQQYLNKKYPHLQKEKQQVAAQTEVAPVATSTQSSPQTTEVAAEKTQGTTPEVKLVSKPSREFIYEDARVIFKVNSLGMAISSYILKGYTDRHGEYISLTPATPGLFEVQWGAQKEPIPFEVEQKESGVFVGRAQVGAITFERELTYHPENFSITQQIRILNPEAQAGQFFITSQDKVLKPESTSWLFPSYEHQDFLTFVGDKKETFNLSHASENLEKTIKAIQLYSLGTQYFTIGFLDQSEILSDLVLNADINSKFVSHTLAYKIPAIKELTLKSQFFIGPKSSNNLKAANDKFIELMDYGMLAFISKPMLASMKWFFSLAGNWGVAIILLTLLVRGIVLPFNLMSYRSMKGMQKIQPLLTELRERYKNDPVTLNREMMNIMRENNANPLAGCLPILLQIPIFFALYRVIGSSVELYQAPFLGWIQDLSLHDKFYVLPILMGVTMYIQQKLTPTTLDPMQAKMLTWMPVIFCLFMLNLPAGLTLYMVVSAVFGIVQQKTFMTLMKS